MDRSRTTRSWRLAKFGDKKSVDHACRAPANRTAKCSADNCRGDLPCSEINCASHQSYLEQSLKFSMETEGYRDLLHGSTRGLGCAGDVGNAEAAAQLIDNGGPSRDPARAAIALALGAVALRKHAAVSCASCKRSTDPKPGDRSTGRSVSTCWKKYLEEERFFVTVRRGYWAARGECAGAQDCGSIDSDARLLMDYKQAGVDTSRQ
jgi:hypothetical protein